MLWKIGDISINKLHFSQWWPSEIEHNKSFCSLVELTQLNLFIYDLVTQLKISSCLPRIEAFTKSGLSIMEHIYYIKDITGMHRFWKYDKQKLKLWIKMTYFKPPIDT